MFNINDRVRILPTGDPNIDQFIGEPMEIVWIELTWADRVTSFLSYTVRSLLSGKSTTVLESEMYQDV